MAGWSGTVVAIRAGYRTGAGGTARLSVANLGRWGRSGCCRAARDEVGAGKNSAMKNKFLIEV